MKKVFMLAALFLGTTAMVNAQTEPAKKEVKKEVKKDAKAAKKSAKKEVKATDAAKEKK
ncbi:hypothetical protein [Flavobacterium sp.]|jgi:hypothetical protein|uniref:hypothetical protein n=1 Tax=Flavobacterium sp. TaxID=239 RepID=UPI0038FC04FA